MSALILFRSIILYSFHDIVENANAFLIQCWFIRCPSIFWAYYKVLILNMQRVSWCNTRFKVRADYQWWVGNHDHALPHDQDSNRGYKSERYRSNQIRCPELLPIPWGTNMSNFPNFATSGQFPAISLLFQLSKGMTDSGVIVPPGVGSVSSQITTTMCYSLWLISGADPNQHKRESSFEISFKHNE